MITHTLCRRVLWATGKAKKNYNRFLFGEETPTGKLLEKVNTENI